MLIPLAGAGIRPPRPINLAEEKIETDWITRQLEGLTLQVARDASLARVRKGDQLVAVIGPLVHCEGQLPPLKPAGDGWPLQFQGPGVTLTLAAEGREIHVAITSGRPCEGPVVRALGGLEQGVFAGLEHLGRGEHSSSKLDIETLGHLRFAPDLDMVTMPLDSSGARRQSDHQESQVSAVSPRSMGPLLTNEIQPAKALGPHPPRAVALLGQDARVAPTQAMKCNLLTSAIALQATGEPAWVATVVFPTNPLFSQSYSGYRNGSVCCFSKIFMPLGRSGLGEAARRPVDGVPLASSAGYRRRSAIGICFPRLSLTTQDQPDISASQWNTSPSMLNSGMLRN